jgi:hypothetical protein
MTITNIVSDGKTPNKASTFALRDLKVGIN